MSGIAHQDQISLVEARRHIQINRTPKVCPREVTDGEKMWDGFCPMAHQLLHVLLALRSSFAGRREAFPDAPNVPPPMCAATGENAKSNPASTGMELIEIAVGPAHRLR